MLSPVKQKSISPPSSKSPGGSPASSKSASSPSIAPPTADVTPVITGDGRIYHPCHGHSFRAVSIFDLFPGIVRHQSKRFTERDRVDFLLAHSERSFLDNVDEAAMWLTALKYLLNDAVLRPFDRLSPEVHFVLRSSMSNHRKRTSLLTSIRTHGLLCVLGSLQQKVPASRDDIRRKMRTAERRRLKREVARREIAAREEARRVYEHQMQMAAAANYHSMYGYNAGNVGNVGANSYYVNGGHAVAIPSVPATQTITQNTPLPKTPPTPTARVCVALMNAPSKLWPTNAHGQVISPNTLRMPVTGVGSVPIALPNAAMGLPILFPVTPTLQNPSGLAPMHSLGQLSPSMTQTRPAHQTWQRAHGRALPANYYTLG